MSITRWMWTKFETFAHGCGKTYSVQKAAEESVENDEKVAIICAYHEIYLKDIRYKIITGPSQGRQPVRDGKIDIWKLHDVLKCIQGKGPYSDDVYSSWWKCYPEFKDYDRVYVDPDCYESILNQIMKQMCEIRDSSTKIKIKLKDIDQLLQTIDENSGDR